MDKSVAASDWIGVDPSRVHGKGVFARQFIPKGTVLPWRNTKEISRAELYLLPVSERRFTDNQDGKIFLVGEPERYVNHSCDSNTHPGSLCDIASRDILIGEEVTADYKNFYILDGSFECRCGSKTCRGTIFGRQKGFAL
jgi:SET domain-containing protein